MIADAAYSGVVPNKWIAEELKKANRRQVDLARHLGVSESVMTKMIHTSRFLKADEADKIRDFLGVTPPNGHARYAPRQIKDTVRSPESPLTIPHTTEMENTLPVYGTALGGASGGAEFIMNGEIGLYVRRPAKLAGRDDVFALFVQGESMHPRYLAGDLIVCETRRPPQIGDFVVVETQEAGQGYRGAYLKRLAGRSGGKVKLEQYNPPKTIEIDQKDIHQMVRVMSTHDLLG